MSITRATAFRNIIYNGAAQGLTLVCLLLTSAIVARNISAADYGVIGFASMIIFFLSRFSDMSVNTAVIRRPRLNQHNLETAFTLKILLSVGAFVVALLVAPFARHLLDHPAIASVVRVLALTYLISILGFLPQTLLTREINFKALALPGVATAVVQCIIAVTLILHGWKYWAVIVANVGSTLVGAVIMQFMKKTSMRLRFDWADMKEYLQFGIPLVGAGLLTFGLFNLDNLLVGSDMGSAQLGYYALAFNWGSFICGLLGNTVHNVLFPAFSAIQSDSAAVRRWYLKTVDLVAFVSVVVNTALLANASFFLVTFLGKGTGKWLPAMGALQILCVYGIVRAVTEPLGSCIQACGRTATLLYANLLAGAVELGLLLLALRTGKIEMVAIAVSIAYAAQVLVYAPFLRREFSITARDIFAKLWPIVPAIGVGWLVTSLLPHSFGRTLFTLAIRGLFTASAVALTHGLFSRFRCFHEAGGMLSQNFARLAD